MLGRAPPGQGRGPPGQGPGQGQGPQVRGPRSWSGPPGQGPGQGQGPPGQGRGPPRSRSRGPQVKVQKGRGAGGMPLAVMQKNCLVCLILI